MASIELQELLRGAGLDIIIPKKDFIKEHRHLVELLNRYDIPALREEASSQANELEEKTGGKFFSAKAGFIRRLMAENRIKQNGQYKKPTWPLHPDSSMNKKAEFKYEKLANREQTPRGVGPKAYGASPFITKHFGQARPVPFERQRGPSPPREPFKKDFRASRRAPSPPPPSKKRYVRKPKLYKPEEFKSGDDINVYNKQMEDYRLLLEASRPMNKEDRNKEREEKEEAPPPRPVTRIRLTAENASDYIGQRVFFNWKGKDKFAVIKKLSVKYDEIMVVGVFEGKLRNKILSLKRELKVVEKKEDKVVEKKEDKEKYKEKEEKEDKEDKEVTRIRLTAENASDYIGQRVFFKFKKEDTSAVIKSVSASGIRVEGGPPEIKNNLVFKGRALNVIER